MTTIKSIKANGFKSFAKNTEFIFDKDGYIIILGPNGSGKSNLIDAVCFVLGRLSAKSMRAEKSANLIYNGGKTGNAAKQAEVSIIFDNSSKQFPLEFDEIEIKRILKENGQSKYKINNETRTRQQVLDLLGAAKINPNCYNIVLQGDVNYITEMASEQRRQILEEISGISVYEDKKIKTLNELEKTEEKLKEASIVLIERESYLKELKNDRDLAVKYKELEKNITRNKATYLDIQIKNKNEKIEETEKRLKENQNKIDKINEDIKKFQEQILNVENQIADINHEIEEKSEIQQLSLQKDISDLKDFISHNSARIESLEKEITRVDERKNQLKINISELDKKISTLQKTKSDLQNKSQNLEKQKLKIQEKIYLISQKDVDEKLEKEIDKCIDNDSLLAAQLSDIHSRYSLLQQKLAVARARQDSVNEVNFSTKAVEEILKLRMKGVYGSVSSLIKADEKFSLALETAAGPRINAIIVENEDIAAKGINHLKKNKLGTAIFLPLNKIKPKWVENKKLGYGLAIKLINYDEKFSKAISYVFGSTFVLENIDETKKNIGKERMVTLDGDLVELSGAMIGGYKKKKALFKDFNEEIQRLDSELKKVVEAINLLEQKRSENDYLLTSLRKEFTTKLENPELNSLEKEKNILTESILEVNSDIRSINIQINDMLIPEKGSSNKIISQHEHETHEFKQEIKDLNKILSEQKVELKQKDKLAEKYYENYKESFKKRDKLNADLQVRKLKINDSENKIKIFEDRINNISIEKAKVISELEGFKQEFEPYKNEQLRRGLSYEQLKEEITKFESMMKDLGNVNLRALEIYEAVQEEYNNLQEKIGKLKQEKEDIIKMIDEIDSKKTSVFLETFNAISSNFQRIFSQLTTKGTAHLVIENPSAPLTEGVRILVKFSTHKYLDIKSLSGGEKTLTALAFLFAIQEYDPASFYVFDEVDAALDKKNSEMLSGLLKDYSKKAQYIIISHNDSLISAASQLYGVSMRENGISNVVSLKV